VSCLYSWACSLYHIWNGLPVDYSNMLHNQYKKSGVYQLTCSECSKKYIGQTGWLFHIRYKEHAREYRYYTKKSNYAKHLLNNRRTLCSMEECMTILHTTVKGPMLNTLKKFCIYKETLNSTQLNNKNTVTPNTIFDAVLHNNSDSTLHI
jgi:hypothetical protein